MRGAADSVRCCDDAVGVRRGLYARKLGRAALRHETVIIPEMTARRMVTLAARYFLLLVLLPQRFGSAALINARTD
ncbi:hypothetical protein DLM46_24695 [Paraburkholderia lacunae]|uniref:Uncharacterized protein n=2 Tax=Paraburkholderia lacunae TaxID=2211104 RepID=A0A370N3M4_9BURK|nr:hypothetical protein DLM46_24695 [Paraburkholderia lacunae]